LLPILLIDPPHAVVRSTEPAQASKLASLAIKCCNHYCADKSPLGPLKRSRLASLFLRPAARTAQAKVKAP